MHILLKCICLSSWICNWSKEKQKLLDSESFPPPLPAGVPAGGAILSLLPSTNSTTLSPKTTRTDCSCSQLIPSNTEPEVEIYYYFSSSTITSASIHIISDPSKTVTNLSTCVNASPKCFCSFNTVKVRECTCSLTASLLLAFNNSQGIKQLKVL